MIQQKKERQQPVCTYKVHPKTKTKMTFPLLVPTMLMTPSCIIPADAIMRINSTWMGSDM